MDISAVQIIGQVVAWSILIVGYFMLGSLVYYTIKRAMKGE